MMLQLQLSRRVFRKVRFPVIADTRELAVMEEVDAERRGDVDAERAGVAHALDPLRRGAEDLPMRNRHLEVMAPAPHRHLVEPVLPGVPGDTRQVLVPD